jgi:hypothetical protein
VIYPAVVMAHYEGILGYGSSGMSRCTHPERVYAIFPEHEQGSNTTNVVYTEVLRGLTDPVDD